MRAGQPAWEATSLPPVVCQGRPGFHPQGLSKSMGKSLPPGTPGTPQPLGSNPAFFLWGPQSDRRGLVYPGKNVWRGGPEPRLGLPGLAVHMPPWSEGGGWSPLLWDPQSDWRPVHTLKNEEWVAPVPASLLGQERARSEGGGCVHGTHPPLPSWSHPPPQYRGVLARAGRSGQPPQDTSLVGGPREPPEPAANVFLHDVVQALSPCHLMPWFLIMARVTCMTSTSIS